MALDYSERRHVPRNRPKRQPVNFFALLVGSGLLITFVLGMLTGWVLGRGSAKRLAATASNVANLQQRNDQSHPDAAADRGQGGGEGGGQMPVLTFYETLSKGNKAVLGTGLNPHKTQTGIAPQPPLSPQPAHTIEQVQPSSPLPLAKGAPLAKPQESPNTASPVPSSTQKTQNKPSPDGPGKGGTDVKGKFTVQIASCRESKEAETLRAKFVEKGLPAYVVQHTNPEKVTYYRVRVGKRLDQREATDLAAKAGKGAMVIPE